MTLRIDPGELVDHHCHGVFPEDLSRAEFEELISESTVPAPPGCTSFDSQLGFLIRSRCAPLLGLKAHCSPDEYIARRTELGAAEVNRRFLSASGITDYLVETGFNGDRITSPEETAAFSGAVSAHVLRLERTAEDALSLCRDPRSDPQEFTEKWRALLEERQAGAVGFKSIAAYRCGLGLPADAPAPDELAAAVREWAELTPGRLSDPRIIRMLLEDASRYRKPIQFHVGFGDEDVDLHDCNPLLLTPWLRVVAGKGVDVTLLHCYPFHREAGYLAHVFPHVYSDIGLAANYVGSRATALMGEFLEVVPFHKALFSSDAYGLAELYYLGAELFRRGYAETVEPWVESGDWSPEDAQRVFRMISAENAQRIYRRPAVSEEEAR